ncbi:MAG: methyltransferase domain-containing protein, partial [Phycisphaerae bacterium]
ALEGCTVLDMGCGTGRDSYLCSKLVGEKGRVIGVDMTRAQLDVAERHRDAQAKKFGYATSNVTFHEGLMEDLGVMGIEDASVDVVISNCVINLAPDKHKVFSEIFRVLKPGGELYFSDVFVDRRLAKEFMNDPVLVGECLAGAMYTHDFRRMMLTFGIADYRIMKQEAMAIHNPIIEQQLAPARFFSTTIRAFKLDNLEDRCEDYGQVATYRGTIENHPNAFELDDHHQFTAHKPMLVCGNTAAMLNDTRFGQHFDVTGDRSRHFGVMEECAEGSATTSVAQADDGACC